jgi:hypothetical protein
VQRPHLKFQGLCQTLGIINNRVSCKVPQTGGTGPWNWGQNKKVGMKMLQREKTLDHGIVAYVGPHRSFGFALRALWLLLMFSITSNLVSERSCKSSDLIPSFVKLYRVLLPLHLYTQIRDEIGNRGFKIGPKDRLTSQICLNVWQRVTMWVKIVVRYLQNFVYVSSLGVPPCNV